MDFTIEPENLLSTLLPLLFAGYLLLNGVTIIIAKRRSFDLLAFGLTNLVMGVILLTKDQASTLLYEIASLSLWPSFYMFLVSQRKPTRFKQNHFLHYLSPALWLLIALVTTDTFKSEVFNALYLLQWMVYIWICLTEVYKLNLSPRFKAEFADGYFNLLFFGMIILIIVRLGIPIIYQDYTLHKEFVDITTAIYLIGLSGYFIQRPLKHFSAESLSDEPSEEIINYEENLKRQLRSLMQKDQVFLNPELTLHEVANKLEIKVPELSQFINNTLNKNFNDFVNEYRVNEFKRLAISSETDSKATVIELAYESGFNSKASFNRIFKDLTGMTPSEYRKSVKPSKNS